MAMPRGEELSHDIASALPAEVVQAYNPTGDFAANQLVLEVGELVWVLEQHESGWWGGHKEGDTKMGWFPKAIVRLARSQTQLYSPVCTNDRRAVASPMGARRSLDSKLQAMQDKQTELLDFNRKLEQELESRSKDLEIERRRRCDEAEEYKAKHGQMLKQLEVLAGELDKAKQDFRQREASYVERCKELDAEVKQLREELRRKEAEQDSVHHQQPQPPQQPQQHLQTQQIHVQGARAPSADVPRRLFEGTRTPPVTVQSQSGPSASMTAASPVSISTYPAIPTGTVTALLSSSGSASGRPASVAAAATTSSLSRASPRTAASAPGLTWVQQQQPPQPPSPHHLHRFAPSPEVPQVRSLVSEFERRSNSQGPGCGAPPRMDPSPSRQYFVSGASRPAGVATSRSGSRDVHYHRGAVQAAEGGEETIPFSFGMSPMQRQVHTMPTPGRPQTIVTSSPQPTVSVQDRIRQFTGVPMPMRR